MRFNGNADQTRSPVAQTAHHEVIWGHRRHLRFAAWARAFWMKLLLDENVANSTEELCRHLNLDVKSVKAEGWEGKDDEELIKLAIAERRIVLSFDKDFGNLERVLKSQNP